MRGMEDRSRFSGRMKVGGFLSIVMVGVVVAALTTIQPTFKDYLLSEQRVSADRLQRHVEVLSEKHAPRSYKWVTNLDACADYISGQFKDSGASVSEQTYDVKGNTYRNVIASFGPETDSRIVVGAHYDSCGDTPGADDNASGVAGLIELSHLLGQAGLKQRVELVAYTLEEPPFFRSVNMGSARHAYRLRKNNVEVDAMICLEMIGCFRDEKGSQRFPSTFLKLLYPDRGNYIAVIGSIGDRKLIRHMKSTMRGATDLPVHAMCAPKGFPGLDFSDHRNYWANDYTAVMITDTSFFRNGHYHLVSDTPETLDYDRMTKVVIGVYEAVVRMANED